MPVLADTPLTVRNRTTGEISVQIVEDLTEDCGGYDALTHLGWTPFLRVVARPSDKTMFCLRNRENVVNVESGTRFLLRDDRKTEKRSYLTTLLVVREVSAIVMEYLATEVVQNITRRSHLASCPIPLSKLIDSSDISLYDRIGCDMCKNEYDEGVPDPERYSELILNVFGEYECKQCEQYNLCAQCYSHTKTHNHRARHNFRRVKVYSYQDLLNAIDGTPFKRYIDIRYGRARMVPTWGGVNTQELLLLLKRIDNRPRIDYGDENNHIFFKANYSRILAYHSKPELSYRKYGQFINRWMPKRFVVSTFCSFSPTVQCEPNGKSLLPSQVDAIVAAAELPREKRHQVCSFNVFNSKKDTVYEVHTQNGFYQAGIGTLVLAD
jgi:hypothetical protein